MDIVSYLREPEKYTKLGARLPKGNILLLALLIDNFEFVQVFCWLALLVLVRIDYDSLPFTRQNLSPCR